jgi:hypothetical protein
VSVVIPYRGDDGGHRDRALAWVLRWWEAQHPAWQVAVGYCPPGPWCKGAALADGLTELDSTDGVVVVADADMITDGVGAAVSHVQAAGGWAVPHRLLHRLTETATACLMARPPAGVTRPPDTSTCEAPYEGFAGGSMTVVSRDLLDQVPIDPRFQGWGQQDEAWAVDLDTVAGPAWRGTADIWHLWHPPQQRESRRWGSPINRALLREHLVARQQGSTRALLAEVRASP